jgi:hypothetical protein
MKPHPSASALRPFLEGTIALASGAILFAAAAALERARSMPPLASAAIEELLKTAFMVAAGLAGRALATGVTAPTDRRSRADRQARLGAARGLSLGLVAAATFAAVENLAYFAAFPEAGALGRLFWSMPVHLVASLVEAIAALPLVQKLFEESPGAPCHGTLRDAIRRSCRRLAAPMVLATGFALGAALHAAANLAAACGAASPALGAAVGLPILVALAATYIDTAYVGGFLHGTD